MRDFVRNFAGNSARDFNTRFHVSAVLKCSIFLNEEECQVSAQRSRATAAQARMSHVPVNRHRADWRGGTFMWPFAAVFAFARRMASSFLPNFSPLASASALAFSIIASTSTTSLWVQAAISSSTRFWSSSV